MKHLEASGGIWEASGGIWRASGARHLESSGGWLGWRGWPAHRGRRCCGSCHEKLKEEVRTPQVQARFGELLVL